MLDFGVVKKEEELQGILDLQRINLANAVSIEEAAKEGFVTVEHDFETLKKLNNPYPHVIAKSAGALAGYALVMLKEMREEIPVLVPMFQQIDRIVYGEKILGLQNYFTIGQICVGKAYRGQGVFRRLYEEMEKRMKPHFDYMITEIDARNIRSLRAHAKFGFQNIKEYKSEDGKSWVVVLYAF